MVDIPLDRLLEIGFENLRHNQAEFQRVAAKIDAKRPAAEILQDLEKDHPAPDKLLDSLPRRSRRACKDFITQHHIITIPSPVLPILEETPPFMRALTFASMDTPGPYEKVAKEAFFNVTLPEPNWPKQQVEEHMSGFNRGTIISTAVHEAYPGHYVQFLWMQHAPTKVRKLIGCSSNAEGWAHYTEQMMLDEGYGNGDPEAAPGPVAGRAAAQCPLHRRHRDAHRQDDLRTGHRFLREGRLSDTGPTAERETKRGTSDPTYLYYTLGKLQILKLRDDYKRAKGSSFSLQEFHDNLVKQGFPPIKIVRQALLGNDSPVL